MSSTAFANASDAEVRHLNLHAPGRRFADFMRALRDGRTPPADYDQHPPPPDGGRPMSEAVIGGAQILSDEAGRRVTLHADIDALRVTEVLCEAGAEPVAPGDGADHVQSFYVLDGELVLAVGERELRAQAGAWVQLPPAVAAAVGAGEAGSVRYLELRSRSSTTG